MKKLSFKIAFSIFTFAFLAIAVLAVFLMFSSEKVVQKYAGEYQVAIAKGIIIGVSAEIDKGKVQVNSIAKSDVVSDFFSKKIKAEQAQEAIINLRRVLFDVKEIDILDLNGEELLSSKGEGIVLEGDRKKIRMITDNEYYKNIKKNGLTVNSDIIKGDKEDEYFIIFTAPIKNESGEIIGFAETESNSDNIRNQLSYLSKDFNVFLINSSGTIISECNNSIVMADVNKAESMGKYHQALVGKNLKNNEIVKLALSEKSAYVKLPSLVSNTESLYGTAKEPSDAQNMGIEWVVIVEKNYSDLYKPIKDSISTLIFVMLILVLGCASGAVFFVQVSISDPLQKIIKAIKEVAKGKKYEPSLTKRSDEVGQLDIAFRATFNELDVLKNSLESKVAEKAKELTEFFKETEKQNEKLELTKRAMINILDDVKESEENVRKAKEGVEEQVKVRTRELAEEQARLTTSINSLPIGFLLLDENDKIILKNHTVSHILEMPESETTIENIKKFFKDKADLEALHEQCVKEKTTVEVKSINIGNKFFRLMLSLVFLTKGSEGVIGHIIMIEDITEEQMLDRSREEFFAIASHEMRTPLTAIRGNMSMIKDFYGAEIKNPDINSMIDDSYKASIRLIGVVNDFLDASRLEQGKISLKIEKVDLKILAKEVERELSTLAGSKKLNLKFEVGSTGSLPLVLADKDRAKQVMLNLISNAINYTQKGGVIASIIKEKDFLQVLVKDSGEGISPQNQNRLFKKFQQAGEQMLARDLTKSTGLGLYISKLLIESMGGKIWLEKSEIGKGSTFAFTLPIAS